MRVRAVRVGDPEPKMSLLGRLMPTIMVLRRSNKNYVTRERLRAHLAELTLRPDSANPPRKLRKDVVLTSRHDHGWRVYEVAPADNPPKGTVVYLHGGGWINEAATAHWRLVEQLAAEACVKVMLPVYPLIHTGGTAATVVPTVVTLCEQVDGPLVVAGDSAGGTIAMSTSLALKEGGAPPDLTILISPALDLRMQNPQIDERQPLDPWLVKEGQIELAEMWVGEHGEDPVLNPFLGDLEGLARVIIFSGTRDVLNPDTRLFVDRLQDAAVDHEYHELAGHLHVYPLLPTPEGKAARCTMVSAVRRIVD